LASKVVPVELDEITDAQANCAVEGMAGQIEPRDMALQEIRENLSTKADEVTIATNELRVISRADEVTTKWLACRRTL
jgi:hypothetical protein